MDILITSTQMIIMIGDQNWRLGIKIEGWGLGLGIGNRGLGFVIRNWDWGLGFGIGDWYRDRGLRLRIGN